MKVRHSVIFFFILNLSTFSEIIDIENGFIIKTDKKIIEICKGEKIENMEKRTREFVKRLIGENRDIKDYKISYLGNTFYIFTYRIFMNGKFLFSISVDPVELSVIEEKIQKTSYQSYKKIGDFTQEIKIGNLKKMDFYFNGLSTSIAMIFTYWSNNKGIKNLRFKKETDEKYIKEINRVCLSCFEISAIEIFCASRKHRAKLKIITSKKENYLKDIEEEIKNNRPVLTKISSCGLAHYGVLFGIKKESSENYGIIYLPIKNGPTYEIQINLNHSPNPITFTLIDIN